MKLTNIFLVFTIFATFTNAIPILDSFLKQPALFSNGVNKYILVFENGKVTPSERIDKIREKITEIGGSITYEYALTITGFSFTLDSKIPVSLLESLNNSKWPFFIEKDSEVKTG